MQDKKRGLRAVSLRILSQFRGWFALVLVLAGCQRVEQGGEGRGVLVITIDGLRADHVFDCDRNTTPNLQQLARTGVAFDRAFSTAPWALPSHVSMLTGCDPNVARSMLPERVPKSLLTVWDVPQEMPRLAEVFLREGYHTAAFFSHQEMAPVQGLFQGFEFVRHLEDPPQANGRAAETAEEFLRWLRGRSADRNWFAYLQLENLDEIWNETQPEWDRTFAPRPELSEVPPHSYRDRVFFAVPHRIEAGGRRSLGEFEAQYDGAIQRMDKEIGRLIRWMDRDQRLANTTLVICGTHGMGFGEAGFILDHGTLTPMDLHVPLVIRPAENLILRRGERSSALVSLTDLAPTLLDLANLARPSVMSGISMVPVLSQSGARPRQTAVASCGHQEGFAAISQTHFLEARLPGVHQYPGLSKSWFGDELMHGSDYCEAFFADGEELYPGCGSTFDLSDEASALRNAALSALTTAHQTRLQLQSSAWGLQAKDVTMQPSPLLWSLPLELHKEEIFREDPFSASTLQNPK